MKKIMFKQIVYKIYFFLSFLICYNETFSQPFDTEAKWKNYFQENILKLKEYEGIYQYKSTPMLKHLDGEIEEDGWHTWSNRYLIWTGDRYCVYTESEPHYFLPTADKNILLYRDNIFDTKHDHECSFTGGVSLTLQYRWSDFSEKYQGYISAKENYLKLYPTIEDIAGAINNLPQNKIKGSGTGFAVSSTGYIVTNYHVIEDATSVIVKGINGNFNKPMTAAVIVSDKANDLALIKITDDGFRTLGDIPYAVSLKNAAVGNNVYALGYPLRATMGDEIKLVNGIISANSGYEGSLNQYQISVPLQPGNSGGPLISALGNIVGVVNAKHLGTENVSYAIKGSFLTNLVESSGANISLPQTNILTGKTLSQQVQLVKKFVYIIEVE